MGKARRNRRLGARLRGTVVLGHLDELGAMAERSAELTKNSERNYNDVPVRLAPPGGSHRFRSKDRPGGLRLNGDEQGLLFFREILRKGFFDPSWRQQEGAIGLRDKLI